jgi:hypothetical protein
MIVVVALVLLLVTAACCASADTDVPSAVDDSKAASEAAVLEASVKVRVSVSRLQAEWEDTEHQVLKLSQRIGTAVEQGLRRHSSKDVFDWYELSDELHRTYKTGELAALVNSALDSGSFAPRFGQQVVAWRYDNGWLTCDAARISGTWSLSVVVRGVAGIQMVTSAPMSEPERGGSWTGYTAGGNWMCLWRSIPDEIDPPTIYACVCDAKSDSCGLLPSIAGHEGLTPVVPGKAGSSVVRDEDAVTIPLK